MKKSKVKKVHIHLYPEDIRILKKEAREHRVSMSFLVRQAIKLVYVLSIEKLVKKIQKNKYRS